MTFLQTGFASYLQVGDDFVVSFGQLIGWRLKRA